MFKTRGLLTIDSFIENVVEKSIFDVKLMNRPRGRNNNTKNDTNSTWFDNRRESLMIIDAVLLRKTMADPTGFISSKSTISVKFVPKNPFTGDNIGISWFGNEGPCIILSESIKLIAHSSMSERIKKGTLVSCGNWRNSCSGR